MSPPPSRPKPRGPGAPRAAAEPARPDGNASAGRAGKEKADRPRGAAREALLAAARAEFDEAGFDGTDSNRIARRAGYAPQTFYRHFADKTAIFVETYHRWLADEWEDLDKARGKGAEQAAAILLGHHARHRGFRRSLRQLTVTNPSVRAARAESRRRQLGLLADGDAAAGRPSPGEASRIALLLCIERIADAAADGELGDLGLTEEDQQALLAEVMRRFATP